MANVQQLPFDQQLAMWLIASGTTPQAPQSKVPVQPTAGTAGSWDAQLAQLASMTGEQYGLVPPTQNQTANPQLLASLLANSTDRIPMPTVRPMSPNNVDKIPMPEPVVLNPNNIDKIPMPEPVVLNPNNIDKIPMPEYAPAAPAPTDDGISIGGLLSAGQDILTYYPRHMLQGIGNIPEAIAYLTGNQKVPNNLPASTFDNIPMPQDTRAPSNAVISKPANAPMPQAPAPQLAPAPATNGTVATPQAAPAIAAALADIGKPQLPVADIFGSMPRPGAAPQGAVNPVKQTVAPKTVMDKLTSDSFTNYLTDVLTGIASDDNWARGAATGIRNNEQRKIGEESRKAQAHMMQAQLQQMQTENQLKQEQALQARATANKTATETAQLNDPNSPDRRKTEAEIARIKADEVKLKAEAQYNKARAQFEAKQTKGQFTDKDYTTAYANILKVEQSLYEMEPNSPTYLFGPDFATRERLNTISPNTARYVQMDGKTKQVLDESLRELASGEITKAEWDSRLHRVQNVHGPESIRPYLNGANNGKPKP